jgi:hypothetical protein
MDMRARALRHALGFGKTSPTAAAARHAASRRTVVVAGADADLIQQIRRSGLAVKTAEFTPFDAEEAAKIAHFDTYNRTAASQLVADIVAALRAAPGAALVAAGDAALAGLFAAAVEPGRRVILDVGTFDTSSDTAFVERLFIPGVRRAGDVSTAAALAGDRLVIHNAGERFHLTGATPRRTQLTAREIVSLLRTQ